MTILIALLSSLVVAVVNALLLRVLSPVRLGLLARLIKGPDHRPVLQIAVESLQAEPIHGPVVIDIRIEHPGRLEPGGRPIGFYGGPEAMAPDVLRVHRTPEGVSITIQRMRGLKTWSFEIDCSPSTRRVRGTMSVPRRPLKELLGNPGAASPETDSAQIHWCVEAEFRGTSGMQSWRAFDYESTFVLVLLLLGGLAGYLGFAFWISYADQTGAASQVSPVGTDLFLVSTFIIVVAVLFVIGRPRWSSIAQGYLERRPLNIESDKVNTQRIHHF